MQLAENTGIEASETSLEPLNAALRQLFELRPLQLIKFAGFIETELVKGDSLYSLEDVVGRFFAALPYWGIPPILVEGFVGKNGATNIKNANKFISHQSYKSAVGQKKDWTKIEKWLASDDFEMPEAVGERGKFSNVEEYEETLKRFIFEADTESRAKLMQLDILPLLQILAIKEPKERKAKTIKSFSGTALESLLCGMKDTLITYQANSESTILAEGIEKLRIDFIHFEHDMVNDDDEGFDSDELARLLLNNCLGGLAPSFQVLTAVCLVTTRRHCFPEDSGLIRYQLKSTSI